MAEEIDSNSLHQRVDLLVQSILAKVFSAEIAAKWCDHIKHVLQVLNNVERWLAKMQAECEANKP